MAHGFNLDGGLHEVPVPGANGQLWLCGKHRIGPDVEGLLAEIGASRVVCLTERHELASRYPAYVEWLDANVGGQATWLPIADLHVPSVEDFGGLIELIADDLASGTSVVVHCAAGIGRAGTTAVGVLVRYGMALPDALAHVRAHRPMAGPEAGAQCELLHAYSAVVGRADRSQP